MNSAVKKVTIASAVLLTAGLLTSCGAGFEPEPSFEDKCGGGNVLQDSAYVSGSITGGEGGTFSTTVTIRLCVDRGGSVIAVDLG